MRKILCLAVVVMFALGPTVAAAASVAAMIERFGLLGTWASDCTAEVTATHPGFRLILAASPGSSPAYTTISTAGGVRMTIHSAVIGALPVDATTFKLLLRIIGGDRDGGPLPSPPTNAFEQVIEKLGGERIRLAGAAPQLLERCPEGR